MAITYPFIGLTIEWSPFIVFVFIGVLIFFFTLITRGKSEYL